MLSKFLKNFTKVIQPFFNLGIKRTNDKDKKKIFRLNKQLKNCGDIYYILTSFPEFHKTMIEIVNQKTTLLLAIQQGKHQHAMKVTLYKYLNVICNFICNPQLIANGATWTSRFILVQQRQEQDIVLQRQNNPIIQEEIREQQNNREYNQDQNEQQNGNVRENDKHIEEKQQHEGSTLQTKKETERYVYQLFYELNQVQLPNFSDDFDNENLIDFDFQNFFPFEPINDFDYFFD